LLKAFDSFFVGPDEVDQTECSIDVCMLSKPKLLTTKNLVLPFSMFFVFSIIRLISCAKGSLPINSNLNFNVFLLSDLTSEKVPNEKLIDYVS
jgi:hypothetical protein